MVVGAKVVLVVELARVAFVADGAVEETHCVGDGVVAGWHIGFCFPLGFAVGLRFAYVRRVSMGLRL